MFASLGQQRAVVTFGEVAEFAAEIDDFLAGAVLFVVTAKIILEGDDLCGAGRLGRAIVVLQVRAVAEGGRL